MRINLCDNENALALAIDRVGHHFFCTAFAVHFRSIDQSHSEIDSQAQRGNLIRMCTFGLAHVPRALTQRRHTPLSGAIW